MTEFETPELVTEFAERARATADLYEVVLQLGKEYSKGRSNAFASEGYNYDLFDIKLFDIDGGHVFATLKAPNRNEDGSHHEPKFEEINRIEFGVCSDNDAEPLLDKMLVIKKKYGDMRIPKKYGYVTTEQLVELTQKVKSSNPENSSHPQL